MYKLISYGQYPLIFLNTLIICYALGIYTSEFIVLSYKYLFLLRIVNFMSFFVLLLSLYLAIKKSSWTFLTVIILFFLIGISRGNLAFTVSDNNICHYENQTITIEGIVCNTPIIKQDSMGVYRVTYVVDVKKVINKSDLTAKTATGKIYLYKKYSNKEELNTLFKINDRISTSGEIHLIRGYHNPGLLNTELMAQQQGIYASLSVGKAKIQLISSDNSLSIKQFSAYIRENILSSLQKAMPENEASLIYAMLFGGYSNIEPEIVEAFTTTGIVHILSVSGSHISLLAGFILIIGKYLRIPRLINFVLLIIIIVFYTILCDCLPPVIRASIMGLLSALALNLHKTYEARHLLSITALIMLFIEPLLLFHISFQLSFLSTAGLIYIMPFLQKKLYFFPSFLKDNIALTLSAQLAVLPLLAWYFNAVSLSSLFANLLAVPPLEFIIIIGLLGSFIGFIMPIIQHFIFILASLTLGFTTDLTLFFAKLPLASIYFPTMPFYSIIIYYCFWFIILNHHLAKIFITNFKKYKFFIAIFITVILSSIFIFYNSSEKLLQIHFIDVGQGDSALIITPTGKSVMIDTGGVLNSDFDIGSRVDIPYLKHYGITKLDYLILSHADIDHAGGASSILQKIPVNHLIIASEGFDVYSKVLKISPDNPLLKNAIIPTEKTSFNIDGVQFDFLRNSQTTSTKSSNEASNVLKLTYHHFSALFMGDLPKDGELDLLSKSLNLQSTILKVAHHGSNTSSSIEFLQAVKPQFSIISAGKYNRFGHPKPEVLERLNTLPTKILRTDEHGAIVFSTDGKKLHVSTFE